MSDAAAHRGRLRARFMTARKDPELVVIEGFHALKHALRFGADIESVVSVDPETASQLATTLAPDIADRLRAAVHRVDGSLWSELSPEPPHTGVLAIAARPRLDPVGLLRDPAPQPIVLLDRPVHLGNIGATVRVAAAAGAAAVLTTGPHDPWHPEAVRRAAGLQFALPVARLDELPASPRPIVALAPDGRPLDDASLPDGAILAFGTERSGLAADLADRARQTIRIPMRPGVSSLNVATAVAVTLYRRTWR